MRGWHPPYTDIGKVEYLILGNGEMPQNEYLWGKGLNKYVFKYFLYVCFVQRKTTLLGERLLNPIIDSGNINTFNSAYGRVYRKGIWQSTQNHKSGNLKTCY